jgi:hypothetical protein
MEKTVATVDRSTVRHHTGRKNHSQVKKSPSLTVTIRRLPLERFKVPNDTRKWRAAARTRRALLLELASYANEDGTFTRTLPSGVERNYSPSAETLEKSWARRTLYRREDDLRDLGLLCWTRLDHYSRRRYRINVYGFDLNPKQVPYSKNSVPVFESEQMPDLK